jgi:hypothetical protein
MHALGGEPISANGRSHGICTSNVVCIAERNTRNDNKLEDVKGDNAYVVESPS